MRRGRRPALSRRGVPQPPRGLGFSGRAPVAERVGKGGIKHLREPPRGASPSGLHKEGLFGGWG